MWGKTCSSLNARMAAKSHATVEFDTWIRLVSDMVQKAAEAEETNGTGTEARDGSGPASVRVKPHGGNVRANKTYKGDNNP